MLATRSLRWSSQALHFGRRKADLRISRQFSIQNATRSCTSLLGNRAVARPHQSHIVHQGARGFRFASTGISSPASTIAAQPPSEIASSVPPGSDLTTTSLTETLDFTSNSLYDIPEHIGYLKELGLDYGRGPTATMEWLLEHVHVLAGTPWWLSITITALLVRGALFYAFVGAADNAARMATIRHVIQPLSTKMSEAFRAGDRTTAMHLRQEMQLINQRAGIKLWKNFVPLLQVFAGYGTFVLLRAMGKLPVPGFETGGMLWFQNLAVPDPFIILPIATASMLHAVLRSGGESGTTTMSPEAMKLLTYGLPLLTVLCTWWLPAALQLSFFVTGCISFVQVMAFKQPKFRKLLNMYPLPNPRHAHASASQSHSPYKGNIKIREPLSTAELDSAFQESRKPTILATAKRHVLDNTREVRSAAGSLYEKTSESMKARQEKNERKIRDQYEKKRQEEIKAETKEMWKEVKRKKLGR